MPQTEAAHIWVNSKNKYPASVNEVWWRVCWHTEPQPLPVPWGYTWLYWCDFTILSINELPTRANELLMGVTLLVRFYSHKRRFTGRCYPHNFTRVSNCGLQSLRHSNKVLKKVTAALTGIRSPVIWANILPKDCGLLHSAKQDLLTNVMFFICAIMEKPAHSYSWGFETILHILHKMLISFRDFPCTEVPH